MDSATSFPSEVRPQDRWVERTPPYRSTTVGTKKDGVGRRASLALQEAARILLRPQITAVAWTMVAGRHHQFPTLHWPHRRPVEAHRARPYHRADREWSGLAAWADSYPTLVALAPRGRRIRHYPRPRLADLRPGRSHRPRRQHRRRWQQQRQK